MINLNDCQIFYDPFPHVVLKNVFDKNFYTNLCNEFPQNENFQTFDNDKENNLKQKKFVLNDENKSFHKIINDRVNTKKLFNYLNSKNFNKTIFEFLKANYINVKVDFNKSFLIKIYEKYKNKKNSGFEFSMISTDGGFIKPHTDGPNKILNFIIPIVDDEMICNVTNSGTKILSAENDQFKYNFLNKTVPYEDTKNIREISFKKNQILFFVKTHNSLHSVGPMENIDNHSLMRKSINFSIYQ